jgi:hypothetical protein
MTETTRNLENQMPKQSATDVDSSERPRKAAVGKALIVWLATGSVGAALIAYLLFAGMGC